MRLSVKLFTILVIANEALPLQPQDDCSIANRLCVLVQEVSNPYERHAFIEELLEECVFCLGPESFVFWPVPVRSLFLCSTPQIRIGLFDFFLFVRRASSVSSDPTREGASFAYVGSVDMSRGASTPAIGE
jgi:hypothetical protein